MVSTNNKMCRLQYNDSFSGEIFMNENSDPFVSLEHAFNQILVSH